MRLVRFALFLFVIVLLSASVASAGPIDTLYYTINNSGGSIVGSVGTLALTQVDASNIQFDLVMDAGFGLLTGDGNDFNFNGPAGLAAGNLSNLKFDIGSTLYAVTTFNFLTGGSADGLGSFSYNLNHWDSSALPNGTNSVNSMHFLLTKSGGISLAQLEAGSPDSGIHFTTAGSDTYWAVGNFVPTPAVPEPASMFLLGTGLFGLAAKLRRKKA